MDQSWPFLDNPNAGVAVAVNPPLVTFGQAKPALQIEIIVGVLELAFADEQPGDKTDHDHGHLMMNRISGTLEAIDQSLERRLAVRATRRTGFEGRRHFLDVVDVAAQGRLLGLHGVEASVNTASQAV
jgi:hypothetical protein